MTSTMISDDGRQGSPLLVRPWLTPGAVVPSMFGAVVAESTGKHRKPDPADEPSPEPVDEPVAVPVVVALPVDVTPDPLAGIRPGDSFLPVPITDPVCGSLATSATGQVYACTRRPHPDHWWHIRVLDSRARQLWAGDGPVAEPHGWPTTDPDTAASATPATSTPADRGDAIIDAIQALLGSVSRASQQYAADTDGPATSTTAGGAQ
ncbi:hypothetical protein SK571_13665 [Lentzea sp. BCCO 10_0798]|uniref:Uncharacterized protein n=1 Tax=Lentzea kristufekii TaxID=3095430 RepID=A0ABU4TQ67_9PSEU|nr:hypothetical protein [Lentzea sp. BCCO 10_0798]MDX8050434.1 hypothetical protein [Lentzea sp. BCCO 10_0798]